MNNSELYNRLTELMQSQLDEVILKAQIPIKYLSSSSTAKATRAKEIIEWANQSVHNRNRLVSVLKGSNFTNELHIPENTKSFTLSQHSRNLMSFLGFQRNMEGNLITTKKNLYLVLLFITISLFLIPKLINRVPYSSNSSSHLSPSSLNSYLSPQVHLKNHLEDGYTELDFKFINNFHQSIRIDEVIFESLNVERTKISGAVDPLEVSATYDLDIHHIWNRGETATTNVSHFLKPYEADRYLIRLVASKLTEGEVRKWDFKVTLKTSHGLTEPLILKGIIIKSFKGNI